MPAKKKSATQLRGAVNNIILESLYSGEKYGYEIIKEVEEKTNGKVKLKQPSLYSSLKRFEAKNYIKSYWADSDIGGKRHYYSLTDDGIEYYRKNVLKEVEEDDDIESTPVDNEEEYLEDKIMDDEVDDENDKYEIDVPDTTTDYKKYNFNVQDKMDELLKDEPQQVSESEELLDELYESKDADEIYSEDELIKDQTELEEKQEIPVDHEFRTPTPITDEINKQTEEEPYKPAPTLDTTNTVYYDVTEEKENVSDNALDDLLYHDDDEEEITPTQTVQEEKPEEKIEEPKPQIYTDEYGITKMYYPDEEKKVVNNKVFDNVVYRTNTTTIFDKAEKEPKKSSLQLDELSDAEREQRTTSFMEKFENRTRELTANREPAYKEPEPEPTPQNTDYKKVLNGLYNTNSEYEPESIVSQEEEYTPTYDEPEEEEIFATPTYQSEDENNYNVKIYTEEKSKKASSKYLLVNKAKFAFGLTMLVFMLLQITIMLVIFKNKGLLMDKQYWIFQVAYVLIAVVTLLFCIPVFISPNKQSSSSFKLGYMLMFGILAFFIVVILTYTINTFIGMEVSNIEYYIPTLLVPTVLSTNFIFGPIIYQIIIQNKKLY